MSGFWATIWVITKYSALIGGSFALIALMIVLFHPIYLSLKGRASLMGQRGEIKLSYLFGLLRLRYIATVHTQDVWLEFGWFRKLLQRESIVNDKVRAPKDTEFENQKEEFFKKEKEENIEVSLEEGIKKAEKVEEKLETEIEKSDDVHINEEHGRLEEIIEENNHSKKLTKLEEEKIEIADDNIEKASEEKVETSSISESDEEFAASINEEDMPKVEATPEQLAQLQSILEEEEKKEEDRKVKKSDWRAKLQKFKKDFNRRYEQLQGKFRLFRQKWNSLWPVVKRFWNRGKKGFRFHDAYLKVEYSLDEHYLTGMLCGYLAPTIGFIKRYGLDFEPVAMFPEKPAYGIYSKAEWYLDIKPYRLVWAVAGLLLEKNIYKEIYWLYKYKKEKRKK